MYFFLLSQAVGNFVALIHKHVIHQINLLDKNLCVKADPRARIGEFSGHELALGAKFRDRLASRAGEGQGGSSAQGLNRIELGIGLGSGHLK